MSWGLPRMRWRQCPGALGGVGGPPARLLPVRGAGGVLRCQVSRYLSDPVAGGGRDEQGARLGWPGGLRHSRAACSVDGMCRNITTLRGLEPAATGEEIEAAARQ